MSNVVATYRNESENLEVEVIIDEFGGHDNPLTWDEGFLRFLALEHRRYDIGTEQHDYDSLTQEWESAMKREALLFPVYMYEHSQVAYSLGRSYPFNCPWDSSQCGFMVVEKEAMEKEGWGRERLVEYLSAKLDEYTAWCNGYIYAWGSYKVTKCDLGHEHREIEDSCGGYIGLDHEELGLLHDAGVFDKDNKMLAGWEEA